MQHDGMNPFVFVSKKSKMLKEVRASGQISVGKKFAGRLFDVVIHEDERFELFP